MADEAVVPDPSASGKTEEMEVEAGGKKVKVAEVLKEWQEQGAKVKELEEFEKRAGRIMRNTGEWDPQYEEDVRYMMRRGGWDESAVEAQVKLMRESKEEPEKDEEPEVELDKLDEKEEGGELRALMEKVKELEGKIKRTSEAAETADLDYMEEALGKALEETLDRNKEIGVLFEAGKRVSGEDKEGKRRAMVREQLRVKTLQLVRKRKEGGGKFRLAWFREEADRAAPLVADVVRTVIGDPNLLRRAPETDSGEDNLVKREPPKPPVRERKDTTADIFAKAQRYAEDTLKHAAREAEAGDRTKA